MSTDAARPEETPTGGYAAGPASGSARGGGIPTASADAALGPAEASSAKAEVTRSLHRSTASYELAFAPVIMALLGLWLDRTIGTTPLFTIGLAVLGIAGAAVSVYYSYDRSMRRMRQDLPWNRSAAHSAEGAP